MATVFRFVLNSLKNANIKFQKLGVLLFVSFILWFVVPVPAGLSAQAFHMLLIFAMTMVGIMIEVCDNCILLFFSLLISLITKTADVKGGLSGFSNTVPWLLFFILSLAQTITKTSLGMRIAYLFMRYFGKGIFGLSYSISLTEFVVAPILPSNTARCASIGYPLVTSLSKYISSNIPGVLEKSVGGYLSLVYCHSNAICSSLFITAMISNAVIVEAMETNGIHITWLSWTSYLLIPSIVLMLILPILMYFLCNPKVRKLESIQEMAIKNYRNLGPISDKEKIIMFMFLLMLVLWILSGIIGVSIIETTLIGLCVFLFLGILDIKDVLSSTSTWNSVIMLAVLISYVNCMQSLGIIGWFNGIISNSLDGFSPKMAFFVLSVIYFLTHYFFSGEGTRIIALYATFLLAGLGLGVDKMVVAMTLAAFSSYSDVLAQYTNPAAITMFGTGYLSAKQWMSAGIVFAVIIIAVWYLYLALRYFS